MDVTGTLRNGWRGAAAQLPFRVMRTTTFSQRRNCSVCDGTDDLFPLLTCDILQADQLVVQGMMASRYLAEFEEVVSGWQTQLSMVR